MIVFHIEPKYLSEDEKKENLDKLKEILVKFHEADREFERVCKELGIPKPEVICMKNGSIEHD